MLRVGLRGRRCSLGDSLGFDDGVGRSPVVWQQLRQVAILQRGQALEDIFEIGPWIVSVELGRFDQAHHETCLRQGVDLWHYMLTAVVAWIDKAVPPSLLPPPRAVPTG